jgi:hypothetical protein
MLRIALVTHRETVGVVPEIVEFHLGGTVISQGAHSSEFLRVIRAGAAELSPLTRSHVTEVFRAVAAVQQSISDDLAPGV